MHSLGRLLPSIFVCNETDVDDDVDVFGDPVDASSNSRMTVSKKEILITGTLIVGVMAMIAAGAILMKMGYFDKIFSAIQNFNTKEIVLTSLFGGAAETIGVMLALALGHKLAHRGHEPPKTSTVIAITDEASDDEVKGEPEVDELKNKNPPKTGED